MRRQIFSRRMVSLILLGALTLLLVVGIPLWVLLAALHDVVRRTRWSAMRVLVLMLLYLVADWVGLLWALYYWLLGPRDARAYARVHWAIQHFWAGMQWRWITYFLRLRLSVEGSQEAAGGPVLLLVRHASLLDTLLPIVCVSIPHGMYLRYVLKSELLRDPAFDIIGHRFPNHFVRRGSADSRSEIAAVARLTEGLETDGGVVIFPEGTRFTPEKRDRILERLREKAPELYTHARHLQHVLPPRLGGTLAMMSARPDADVVFCAHRGLEGFSTLGDLLSGGLVGSAIRVRFWRVPAGQIPRDRRSRIAWLFRHWARVDRFAAGQDEP